MKIFTWKQRLYVFGVTLTVAGIFVLAGFLIGKAVGNVTTALIVAVLVSYPFSQFALAKAVSRLAKREAETNKTNT